jgi:phenylacetate-CoA ligase
MSNLPRILYCLARALQRLKWNEEKLREYQLRRLRQIINYAYTYVPFYHRKFKSAGVSPGEIRTLEDLARVPITKKDELRRQRQESLVSQEFLKSSLRVVTTSGSTGKPFRICMTGAEDDWRKAIYMRANVCCGQRLRDKWIVIVGPNHFSNVTRLQRILRIYTRTCISVFEDVATQFSLVRSLKPNVLDGYSSSMLMLAREMEKSGHKDLNPRVVFGNAEVITDASQKYIEEVFQAPYYDQYGCAEFNRTAWQCPEKIGYHMDEDSVIAQFVDEDGHEVSSGKRGEIIYTSLFSFAMPFIRYQVGDLGVPSDEKCPCGRILPLMKMVEGRKDSLIVLPDGQTLSPRVFTVATSMYKHYGSIEQFRIIQKKVDLLEILIKPRGPRVDKKVMEAELVAHFNRTLGLERQAMRFDIKFVEDIPVGKSGKLMSVVSEVRPNS